MCVEYVGKGEFNKEGSDLKILYTFTRLKALVSVNARMNVCACVAVVVVEWSCVIGCQRVSRLRNIRNTQAN